MKERKVITYSFDELSEEVKKKVLDRNRYWNVEGFEWWDYIYDDAKAVAKILGIEINDIYFSGFYSQGDGACFEGFYEYAKDSCKKIREYAPKDKELHRIADTLRELQRQHFYTVWASVKHRGYYYNEICTEISVDWEKGPDFKNTHDEVCETLRDFMRWIYRRLEEEYGHLTSDTVIQDTFAANESEFTEDGKIFCGG